MVKVELESVEDYTNQGASLAALHLQFVACDGALERMELLLSSFRSQLGGLSSDILQLQHQSGQLGLRLANRQGARSLLGQVVDDLVIPESLIRHLLETPVTEPVFSEQLLLLQAKLALSAEQQQRCSRAAQVSGQLLVNRKPKLTFVFSPLTRMLSECWQHCGSRQWSVCVTSCC